jgi:small conductance mechanosensitive channel
MQIPDYAAAARRRLAAYRRSSLLAVGLTGLLLVLWGEQAPAQHATDPALQEQTTSKPAKSGALEAATTVPSSKPSVDPVVSVREATGTVGDLLRRSWALLPKLLIALLILGVAALLARLAKRVLRSVLTSWDRSAALSALVGATIYLLALGAALSVVAGDARALVGSVGLAGLALSWALQTPIESFTGWLLNSLRGYYRVGDRIAVGTVFGDVFAIDFLTTTVWEAGGPGKPVQGAQPTGALITFPNLEVLRNNIVNYTREFPHVWDEVSFGVTNESDLAYAAEVVQRAAAAVLGDRMREPAQEYLRILRQRNLDFDVADAPQVFVSLTDSWTNLTVRYLVPARERRAWASRMIVAISAELAKPEHASRLKAAYPRTQVEIVRGPASDAQPPQPA